MPADKMMDDGMDSMYEQSMNTPAKSQASQKPDAEMEDESEILAAKSDLPQGIKKGDSCTFEVTGDYGDEFGLTYMGKETGSSKPEGDMGGADEELDRMSETEQA